MGVARVTGATFESHCTKQYMHTVTVARDTGGTRVVQESGVTGAKHFMAGGQQGLAEGQPAETCSEANGSAGCI